MDWGKRGREDKNHKEHNINFTAPKVDEDINELKLGEEILKRQLGVVNFARCKIDTKLTDLQYYLRSLDRKSVV